MKARTRVAAAVVTAIILALIARRIPLAQLGGAFRDADYAVFLALMVPNTIFYFCWDTLILKVALRWFHGDVPYRDLLPVRASSYVVGFFNTNAGRGALAAYLWRRLGAPFLELGSTVIFLVLTEYTQLVAWSILGVFGFRTEVTLGLLPVAVAVAAFWLVVFGYTRLRITPARAVRWLLAPRDWQLLRTFRRMSAAQFLVIVVLRAPMFVVSLAAHYYAARAFGVRIPFAAMLTFLPVIFMAAALPVTIAHLGTTQAAWIYFFGAYAATPRLLAFSLAAHLTFSATRALLGLAWLPVAYGDLVGARAMARPGRRALQTTALVALAIGAAVVSAQEAPLATVVERVGTYASEFQDGLSNVVAEERYVQDVSYRNLLPGRIAANTHRELRSDVLLVRAGSDRYTEFRDVFEVDGRPVRDRQERLTSLFLDPTASADTQIRRINEESARYNIGNVERTINTPTLALQFVLPANRPRFRFTRVARSSAPSLLPAAAAAGTVAIEYEEMQRPTLIRTTRGLDLPVRGRLWTDAATGRIAITELITEDQAVRATIDVAYRWDDRAQLMMPSEMRERYDVRRDGATIVGAATYTNVRQFQVRADERLGAAPRGAIDAPPELPAATRVEPSADLPALPIDARAPGAQAVVPAAPPTFRSGTALVVVDFVVTDRSDRPVAGLQARDFVVKEDGKARPIESFEAYGVTSPPAADGSAASAVTRPGDGAAIVLVDDLHLTPDQAARLRPALGGLLTIVRQRSGVVGVVAPASKVSAIFDLSSSDAEVRSAVATIDGFRHDDRTNVPMDDAEGLAIARRDLPTIARVAARFVTVNPELNFDQAETLAIERGTEVAHDARDRRDRLYDTALLCLDWLATRGGRHGLIVVSGGFAADPDDAKYFDVVTRSLRANAPIDFLDARGLAGFDRYHDVEFGVALGRTVDEGPFGRFAVAEASTGLAVDTGGVAVVNTNDMRKGLDQLLDSMTTYYVLAYRPPAHDKRGYRRIKVEVRVKGLRVRARRGYASGPQGR